MNFLLFYKYNDSVYIWAIFWKCARVKTAPLKSAWAKDPEINCLLSSPTPTGCHASNIKKGNQKFHNKNYPSFQHKRGLVSSRRRLCENVHSRPSSSAFRSRGHDRELRPLQSLASPLCEVGWTLFSIFGIWKDIYCIPFKAICSWTWKQVSNFLLIKRQF